MKLSDKIARDTRPTTTDLILWDELRGFGLRFRNGKRTWIIQYRDATKATRRFVIGTTHEMTVVKARSTAADLLAGIRLGKYPHVERLEQRQVAEHERDRAVETFGAVSQLYLQRQQKRLRPRSFVEVTRHIEKHWSPLHRTPIHEISRRDIALRLVAIAEESGAVAANRARATLSSFYGWAAREGIVEANPVIFTNHAIDEKPRDRTLTDEELAAIWRACDQDAPFDRIVRILMLTGQRRDEIGNMGWEELDLDEAMLTLEGARTKNGKRHCVPLTREVLDIIAQQPRAHTRVFSSGKDGYDSWSKGKAVLDAKINIAPWRLHDLRRTMRTVMSDKLNVPTEVAEALLNHVKKGIEKVYNTSQYLTQKRAALELWASYVQSTLDGRRKVVPLRASR